MIYFLLSIVAVTAQQSEIEVCCEKNAREIRTIENETDTIEMDSIELLGSLGRIRSRIDAMRKKLKDIGK